MWIFLHVYLMTALVTQIYIYMYMQYVSVCRCIQFNVQLNLMINRDTLTKEIAQLEGDISFLHSCLEDEAEFRSSGSLSLSREPTLTGFIFL